MAIDITERILDGMNSQDRRINDHCVRITKLEHEHKLSEKRHANTVTYFLGAIVVIQFLVMMFKEYM